MSREDLHKVLGALNAVVAGALGGVTLLHLDTTTQDILTYILAFILAPFLAYMLGTSSPKEPTP